MGCSILSPVLDAQVQREGMRTGPPTLACWEEPGCRFVHVSACRAPSTKANCQRNPEGTVCPFFQPLWMSGSCIHLIHLKAKVMRSNESQADDLSLRSPESWSPYLVLLPSPDGNCMNVSSSRLCCKHSYLHSAAYLLPLLTELSHNSPDCMLKVLSQNVICDISIWMKRYMIFSPINTYDCIP